MYASTGATGKLGRLVLASLSKMTDPSNIVAAVSEEALAASEMNPLLFAMVTNARITSVGFAQTLKRAVLRPITLKSKLCFTK